MSDDKKIIIDEDWKSQIAAEKETLAKEHSEQADTVAEPDALPELQISVDEWREMGGHPALEDEHGAVFNVPFAVSPVRNPDDLVAGSGAGGTVTESTDPRLPPGISPEVGRAFGLLKTTPFAQAQQDRIEAISARIEPEFERTFVDTVTEHQNSLDLGAIASAIASNKPDAAVAACDLQRLAESLFGTRFARQPFEDADGTLLRLIGGSLQEGGEAAADAMSQFGISFEFDVASPQAVEWAHQHAAQRVVDIGEETRLALRAIVERSLEDRLTAQAAAREIRSVVGLTRQQAASLSNLRAELEVAGATVEQIDAALIARSRELLGQRASTIARTELIGAANQGQTIAWDQAQRAGDLPTGQQREWVTAQDERVDDQICAPLNGQRQQLGKAFSTSIGSIMSPPAHPNCRCAVALVPPTVPSN